MLVTNLLLIACTLFFEASGESLLGKQAVASVIWNRHIERHLTLEQVCRQPRQFSCWNNRQGLPKVLPKGQAWKECLFLAQQMVDGEFRPAGVWNHYYAYKKCEPYWGKLMTDVEVIGNHKFGVLQ